MVPATIDFGFKVHAAQKFASEIGIITEKIDGFDVQGPKTEVVTKLEFLFQDREDCVKRCVKVTSIISACLVLAECLSLYLAWEKVKHASNIVEKHKKDLPAIEETIQKMQIKAEKLSKWLTQGEAENGWTAVLEKKIERLANQLSFESANVMNSISKFFKIYNFILKFSEIFNFGVLIKFPTFSKCSAVLNFFDNFSF